jgi:PhzF family phenazine biosynthesis protein
VQVDAFADQPFAGNPAAVCLVPRDRLPLADARRGFYQAVAAEMNLSETAFLECAPDQGDDFSRCTRFALRWFTPALEVPLCGHATMAAAAALFFGERNPAGRLRFDTLSGELSVALDRATGQLAMDLPLLAPAAELPADDMGIGSELVHAAVGELPVEAVLYEASLRYLVIVLQRSPGATRRAFEGMQPDVARLRAAHAGGLLAGVVVTLEGDVGGAHDFYSRFFGPWAGIDEDPVTGSAHSLLGPFWAARLGKARLAARQCSRRGGELAVEVRSEAGRVCVSGSAVIVLAGRLLL